MTTEVVTHRGYCHCQKVSFEFDAPRDLVAWDCNCSICAMKRNVHTIIPGSRFRLDEGAAEALTTYTFNTHLAKHMFCKYCGVQPFYIPRSNPDGFAVTIHCIVPGTVRSMSIQQFDGQNWDAAYETTCIAQYSKK